VLSRFRLASADEADAGSEDVLLTIAKPFDNHNGGQLAFGPRDGYLYIGTGDGGQGGPADPDNRAQTIVASDGSTMLLGKLLRIDVESGGRYTIPATNPEMAGRRSEIWAMGLRNPWRFSFDRANGDLYIADVGQSQREEIDLQPAGSTGGENYGWRYREGTTCFTGGVCDLPGLVPPIVEYPHEWSNCAVVGGYVYRGQRYTRMRGIYFYGDYCTGRVWGLARDQAGGLETAELMGPRFSISSFGEDENGELYVVDYGGTIYRLIDPGYEQAAPTPTATPIVCLSTGGQGLPTPMARRLLLPLASLGCAP
jgi:glucose/arabinose dehydrogenase